MQPATLNPDESVDATGYADAAPGFGIDIHDILAAIYRSRFVIIGLIVASILAAIVITLFTTRQYQGTAIVEVQQEASKVLGTEEDRESAQSKLDVDRFLDTQMEIVKSRLVATSVANDLGLFKNDFLTKMDIDEESDNQVYMTAEQARREQVIAALLDNLEVGYTGQTRLLTIRFYSPDPALSTRIANSYAENYIRSNLVRKSDSSSYALEFLQRQLREAQARLEESEQSMIAYGRRTQIVDASNAAGDSNGTESTQPKSLITARLVNLNNAYSEAVAAKVLAEQRWRRLSGMAILSLPEVLANPAVQKLLENRALIEAELREQQKIRKDDYPSVIQTRARLDEVNRQLNSLAQNIRSSVESGYQVARQQESQLKAELDALKSDTLAEQGQGVQLSILRREADTNRQQYEALLRRYNQLNAESGVQSNNLAVVDRAVIDPIPSSPKVYLNIALAVLVGLMLSALYILAQINLFDRIRTPSDVTDRAGYPVLGAIPKVENVLGDMEDLKSEVSESINLVRTALTLSSQGGAPRSVMVTSVQASEGKSSSALAVAISFARIGKRVLIIDLDLRRPNVHRLMDLSNKTGASSVLSGQVELGAAVQKSSYPNIDVLTSGPIPPNPVDLFIGDMFSLTLVEAHKVYDMVVVDAPPMLALADAEVLSAYVEQTIFIVESGRNSPKAVIQGMRRLVRNRGQVVGVILTKYEPAKTGYGMNGDYTYGYKYETSEKAT